MKSAAVLQSLCVLLLHLVGTRALVREYVLNITDSYLKPDGIYRDGYLINGTDPGPSLFADEGDTLRVTVYNNLPVEVSVHFHGIFQKESPWADGPAGVTQRPIKTGDSFVYEFTTEGQYGYYWYHAHYRNYLQDGVRGTLYVRPKDTHRRPYRQITNSEDEILEILELEKNPYNLVLNDWYKWDADAVLARESDLGIDPTCFQSILINGKGRVTCHSNETLIANAGPTRLANGTPRYDSFGCADSSSRYPDLNNDAAETPGHSSQCVNTYSDREIFYVNGSKWMMFNVVNAGASFNLPLSIDGHDMYVIMVEGSYIKPQKVKQLTVILASRYTILVKTDKTSGVYNIRAASSNTGQILEGLAFLSYDSNITQPGDNNNGEQYQNIGGILLNSTYEVFNDTSAYPYDRGVRAPRGRADKTIDLYSDRLTYVTYTLLESNATFPVAAEIATPLLFRNDFSDLPYVVDQDIKVGDVVDIIINNSEDNDHPLHLHGHSYFVISQSEDQHFPYANIEKAINAGYPINFDTAPQRDTYMIAKGGHLVLRYIANNPGVWLFHCHINAHMMGGMMIAIVEDISAVKRLMARKDMSWIEGVGL
ncbi:Cupredoxin [Dipodascopsis uninucleata]